MISFMVVAAPRSGTAWVANWLTSELVHCIHDPLFKHHYEEWDSIDCSPHKVLGVACTGIAVLNPKWLNYHPAVKVVLHRRPSEINESLEAAGLTPLGKEWDGALAKVHGLHVSWQVPMTPGILARAFYEDLTGMPYDEERHRALCALNVQRDLSRIEVYPAAFAKGQEELLEAVIV